MLGNTCQCLLCGLRVICGNRTDVGLQWSVGLLGENVVWSTWGEEQGLK